MPIYHTEDKSYRANVSTSFCQRDLRALGRGTLQGQQQQTVYDLTVISSPSSKRVKLRQFNVDIELKAR
jgi:hypothetical protein